LPGNIKAENLEAGPGTKKKEVELTKQEIAGMTGLRVETVIRLMRNLGEKQLLDIERAKVFY
jgi:CRP-like cAMP-binding protein